MGPDKLERLIPILISEGRRDVGLGIRDTYERTRVQISQTPESARLDHGEAGKVQRTLGTGPIGWSRPDLTIDSRTRYWIEWSSQYPGIPATKEKFIRIFGISGGPANPTLDYTRLSDVSD